MDKARARHARIALYLLSQDCPVPGREVVRALNINSNTFRKDISCVDELLRENGLNLRESQGGRLDVIGAPEAKQGLRATLESARNKGLAGEQRMWYIAGILLLSERIPTVEDLCELLELSKPTVVKCIRDARSWLQRYRIDLVGKVGVGYFLEGREEDIRDAFVDSIRSSGGLELQQAGKLFGEGSLDDLVLGPLGKVHLSAARKVVNDVEADLGRQFTDLDVLMLAITTVVSALRIGEGHGVSDLATRDEPVVVSSPVSNVIRRDIVDVEHEWHVQFSDSEVLYLSLRYIGARTQKMEDRGKFSAGSRYLEMAEDIIELTNELLGPVIRKEDDLVPMLAYHLESTLTAPSPVGKPDDFSWGELRKEYPIAVSIAEAAARRLDRDFQVNLPETEKKYIALYVAACLEKVRDTQRKKVAVVCPLGIVSSELLYYRLKNEMPEMEITQVGSIRELSRTEILDSVDFIISTVPVHDLVIPHVVVSPVLGIEDKRLIRKMLASRTSVAGRSGTPNLLDERLICAQVDARSPRAVIELLSGLLVQHGFARTGLLANVLAREREFPSGVRSPIPMAIPHGSPEFTIEQGCAVATLKHPVEFSEMGTGHGNVQVRLVVLPVLSGSGRSGREFYDLVRKLQDVRIANELLHASSPQEMTKILNKP